MKDGKSLIPYNENDKPAIIACEVLNAHPKWRYYVKQIILKTGINCGERISLLMCRKTGAPVTLANEHLLDGKRLILSPNTRYRMLSFIGMAYEWASLRNIVIAQRLRSGVGFTSTEINSLFMFLRRRRISVPPAKPIIGKNELRARLIAIRGFVTSTMRETSFGLNPLTDAERLNALQDRIEMTEAAFKGVTPSKEASRIKKGLTQETLVLLLETIRPDSPTNPWKDPLVRHRNYAYIIVLIVTGGRRGDVAKLKLIDIVFGDRPYIRFDPDVNDPKDTRTVEPRLKTQPREYPISAETAQIMAEYIKAHRSNIPGSSESDYVFLETTKGRPMSLRRCNDVFEDLQSLVPYLTPHILRHTKTESLKRNAKNLGLGEAETVRTIMYLNGWLTDNMKTYTAGEREETARVIATSRQAEFFGK